MQTENIFCPKCGSKQQGNTFCSKCGNKLTGNELKKEADNEIFDTRRPVKENKGDNIVNKDPKSKDDTPAASKINIIIILILTTGYCFSTILLLGADAPIIILFPFIFLVFILFRYLKLLFEFTYFSISIYIVYFISNGADGYYLGTNFLYLVLGIYLPYIIIFFLSWKSWSKS